MFLCLVQHTIYQIREWKGPSPIEVGSTPPPIYSLDGFEYSSLDVDLFSIRFVPGPKLEIYQALYIEPNGGGQLFRRGLREILVTTMLEYTI